MPPRRIVELAQIISSNTSEVDTYLSTHGLPPFSFELEDGYQRREFPDGIQRAQNAVLEATDELHSHMLGPTGILMQLTVCLLDLLLELERPVR